MIEPTFGADLEGQATYSMGLVRDVIHLLQERPDLEPEMVEETIEQVKLLKSRLKEAHDRHKKC